MTQLGTGLDESTINEEILNSSTHILKNGQYGAGHKGLQQFFAPPELAELAVKIIGESLPVFDPTAGDGSFLKGFPSALSFGVEIHKEQIKAAEGSYHAIQGDIKDVFPMIERASPQFHAIVANPPFGLKDWADDTINDGKPVGSAVLTFVLCYRMLAYHGQMIFVCGKDQFYREIADLPEARGVYCVLEVDDLFEDTKHPCAIAFAVQADNRRSEGFEKMPVPRNLLATLVPAAVIEARGRATHRIDTYNYGGSRGYDDAWEAIQKEHTRRRNVAESKKVKREYDIELVGGRILNVLPSPFAKIALAKANFLGDIQRLHGKPVNYFATYERDWKIVSEALEQDYLTIDPRVLTLVEDVIYQSRRSTTPRYPIKETQRLGYLTDLAQIECKKSDPERNFEVGVSYPVYCRTVTRTSTITKVETARAGENAGEPVERKYEQQRKALQITINNRHHFYDDDEHREDIRYLVEHFVMPDPGDVSTLYPEEVEANRRLLREIEADTIIPNSVKYHAKHPNFPPVRFRKFQVEDLARLMIDTSGLVAWEQGLGKTLGALAFIESSWRKGAQRCALIVAPQDLLPQWERECERFLGIKPTIIKTAAQAKKVALRLRMGGEGVYITYYEALAINGTSRSEMLPEVIVESRSEYVKVAHTGKYGPAKFAYQDGEGNWIGVTYTDGECSAPEQRCQWVPAKWDVQGEAYTRNSQWIEAQYEDVQKHITSKQLCPECKADRKDGWNGKYCRHENNDGSICGYSHYLHRVKPMGSHITTAFKKGCIVVDELTMIQGDYSERSKVVRGLRARHRLGMTGTPVKNYIPQAFWLLWWCLGNASKRFPYDYGSKSDFENNHAVIQWLILGNKKGTRKVLPEVTNLSQLWRLLASSIVRRRKEESGERIVPRWLHPITTPLGEAQLEQMEKWRRNFAEFFKEKYPDHPVVKAGAHEVMAPMLGMGMKLDYAATIPEADPDFEWTEVEGVSNFTPANLRTLELVMTLVKQGRKVLVGSEWVAFAPWIAEQLETKGVKVVTLLDETGSTIPPKKRAAIVNEFQTGEAQVLCSSIRALRLGHNLDAASAAVINGLPWDYESFDQFIARIHRLTSTKRVDVFVVIPGTNMEDGQPTISGRKWEGLTLKGQAANLALDGRLIEQNIEPLSEKEVMDQLIEKGLSPTGNEVAEEDVEATWNEIPHIDHYEVDEGVFGDGEGSIEFEHPANFSELILEATFAPSPLPRPEPVISTVFADLAPPVEPDCNYGCDGPCEVPTPEQKDLGDQLMQEVEEFFASLPQEVEPELPEPVVTPIEQQLDEDDHAVMDDDLDAELVPAEDPDEMVELDIPVVEELPTEEELEANDTSSSETPPAEPEQFEATLEAQLELTPEPAPVVQRVNPLEVTQAIRELKELHSEGILDDAEFAAAKAGLIASLKEAA